MADWERIWKWQQAFYAQPRIWWVEVRRGSENDVTGNFYDSKEGALAEVKWKEARGEKHLVVCSSPIHSTELAKDRWSATTRSTPRWRATMATDDEVRAVLDRYRTTGLGGSVPDSKRMAAALADAERSRDELRRAFADGLEQRRLTLLPDTEREVHFAELQDRITELERELAALREENERLHSTARDLVRALDAAARKGET